MWGRKQVTIAKQPQAVFPTVLEPKGDELRTTEDWAAKTSSCSPDPGVAREIRRAPFSEKK